MIKSFIRYLLYFVLMQNYVFGMNTENSFIEIRGKTAAIFHLEQEQFLYAKNIDQRIYPASMTKIATALFILRNYPSILNQYLTVKREAIASISPQVKKQSEYRSPPYWLETDGVTIQLKFKEEILGKELLYALLLNSANDAANVLASSCCNSIPAFMQELNQFLQTIGCTDTHFNNPHGLHHPDHFTTTRDLTCMMKEALKEPLFLQIIHTLSYTMAATNLSEARILSTTNKLLLPTSTYRYAPCIGGKTGTTQLAGKNIIFVAEKHNRPIIVAVTGYQGASSELYQDAIALSESIFNEKPIRHYFVEPTETFTYQLPKWGTTNIPLPHGLFYDYYASESVPPTSFSLQSCISKFPVAEGECIGTWIFKDKEGNILAQEPAYASKALSLTYKQKICVTFMQIITSLRSYMLLALIGLYLRIKRPRSRRTSRYHC